jgi:5-methylcytosine-specific restriction endonuclease McrA
MTEKQRKQIFDKYDGLCSYCGCELTSKFHVDHIEPIRRNSDGTCLKPNESIENLNPACPSCNIMKHSYSLEYFREIIKKFVNSLNLYNNQYKFAKKYGLVQETEKEVIFYFETL